MKKPIKTIKAPPEAWLQRDAYTACLLDIRGHICIARAVRPGKNSDSRVQHWLKISVNCRRPFGLADWIRLNYSRPGGGMVGSISAAGNWSISSRDARDLLQLTIFYSRKRELMNLAISFQKHIDRFKLSSENMESELSYREDIMNKITILNNSCGEAEIGIHASDKAAENRLALEEITESCEKLSKLQRKRRLDNSKSERSSGEPNSDCDLLKLSEREQSPWWYSGPPDQT